MATTTGSPGWRGFFSHDIRVCVALTVGALLRLNSGENIWRWVWLAVAILLVMFAIVLAKNKTPHKHPTASLLAGSARQVLLDVQ
jgi:hypothetical protein